MRDLNALALPELHETLAATGYVRRLLEIARDEDLGPPDGQRDVTSLVVVEQPRRVSASVVCREAGVVAGLACLPELLDVFETDAEVQLLSHDGAAVEAGATLATLDGDHANILTLERALLNLLGRLCGVATHTARFVEAVGGTNAQILDTRKTTPGLRVLEKYAVRCGGGRCHRLGLHDAVLIKDNHLAGIPLEHLTARVTEAASRAWKLRIDPGLSFVEVEVDSPAQLERVLAVEQGLVDIVLLDNFSEGDMRAAVRRRDQANRDLLLEASGGVSLDTVRAIAETGVDRISSGALTHHAVWQDVALDVA
jgi:nicotinate-nucleotide pyrophosphorylase (carboxylating)